MTNPTPARLLCTGLRGALPGDPLLESDLDACRRAGVGAVILFDVDVPTYRRQLAVGLPPEEARRRSPRNILDPAQLLTLTDYIRAVLGDHVLIAVDQEGGQVARLAPWRGFRADPSARAFAALVPAEQVRAARAQAAQLAAAGIDLNFAPCVDLDSGADNPIIGGLDRAYAADPDVVTACARTVIAAHRDMGVAACLKHFPGHGSSRADTHLGAVDVTGTWNRDAELAPYRALRDEPNTAVMVAHVRHRGLDPDRPASLSPAVVDGLLRGELGFRGAVVTDSIDMRAVADHHAPEEAAVLAVRAGCDLVVDGFNLTEREEHPAPAIAGALEKAFNERVIVGGQERLELSMMRLRSMKQ